MTIEHDNIEERVGKGTLIRISKLLTMAKDKRTNENEAHSAMQSALAPLSRYNITASDVENSGIFEEAVGSESFNPTENRNHSTWRSQLINSIASTHFCHVYRRNGGEFILTGKETNRAAAMMLFQYLSVVIEENALQAVREYDGWESKKTYGNAYRLGMVTRINERLIDQKRQIIQEASSNNTEIVAVNPYEQAEKENQAYVKSKGVKLSSHASSSNLGSGAGWHRGRKDGERVGLTAGRALGYKK